MNRRHAQRLLFSLAFGFANVALSQGVTYDFTGFVIQTEGEPSTVVYGSTVTGTYTFNYAAAQASSGTPGSGSWDSSAAGGTVYGVPPPAALVFSSTAHVGGVSYSTATPISSYYAYSDIGGYPTGNFGPGSTFGASEDQASGPEGLGLTQSNMGFTTAGGLGYSSKGLPLAFGATNPNSEYLQGEFGDNNGYVDYYVTTLTPARSVSTAVPEADITAMMLAGLALLGVAMTTRHRNSLG